MTSFDEDPNYEECIVTYLDVLGFRTLIAEKSAEEVQSILNRFRRSAQPYKFDDEAFDMELARMNANVEIVSDAIVRARPIKNDFRYGVLAHELMDLQYTQIDCISNGIVIRGALTIDYLHLGDGLRGPYFGPGLIRAYEMERHDVIFPRIMVEERVVRRFKRKHDPSLRSEDNSYDFELQFLHHILKEDDAGLWFIDYLNAGPGEFDSGYGGLLEFFQRHHNLIVNGLDSAKRTDITKKYKWLQRYHNLRISEEMNNVKLDDFVPEYECTMREILEPLIIE